MLKVSFTAVLLIFLSVLSGCGDNSSDPNPNLTSNPNNNVPSQQGVWISACFALESGGGMIERYNFVDASNVTITRTSYNELTCSSIAGTEEIVSTYTIGDTVTTAQNKQAYKIDFIYTELNGTAVPVNQQQTYYQIFRIENIDKLYMGMGVGSVDIQNRPNVLNGYAHSRNVMVSAGGRYTCGLFDTYVECWGESTNNQMNIPTLSNPYFLDTSLYNSCALDDTGVVCWGRNTIAREPQLTNPRQISVSTAYACAIDSNGLACWGGPAQFTTPFIPSTITLNSPKQVEVLNNDVCVLDETSVYCWTYDAGGNAVLTAVPSLNGPRQISLGRDHACALDNTGLVCWGADTFGESTALATLVDPIQVAVSRNTTCVLDNTANGNKVVCWGREQDLINVPTLSNPRSINVGWIQHACALDDTGIVCWGNNAQGQTTVPSWN